MTLLVPEDKHPYLWSMMMSQLRVELNLIWDKIPIDALIATYLDPRMKNQIRTVPISEMNEAMNLLKKEYLEYMVGKVYLISSDYFSLCLKRRKIL